MQTEDRLQWFGQLRKRLALSPESARTLVAEVKVALEHMEEIKRATSDYLRACFRLQGQEVAARDLPSVLLDEKFQTLANRTPNGILMPKKELETEFNSLHRQVALWLSSLEISDLITSIHCPLTVRAVKGRAAKEEELRPYASSKLHLDLFTGEPADTVNVMIVVLGDIERTTVEFYEPPSRLDERCLKPLSNYDDAGALFDGCKKYSVTPRHGHAYFSDAIVPHRTVRKNGGVRVSIDFRLRRATDGVRGEMMEGRCSAGRLAHYIPCDEWLDYGKGAVLTFPDKFEDAKQGKFPATHPYNLKSYEVAKAR